MSAFFCKNSVFFGQNSRKVIFPLLPLKIPFFDKFIPKNQNCQFKLKFSTKSNLNMQASVVMFTFSVFDWRYPFWANLVQKTKIVSFRWNLTPRLIRICNSVYLVCFRLEILSLDKLGPKNQNCQFKLKFGSDINSNMQNSMVIFTFFVFDWRYPFWANLV